MGEDFAGDDGGLLAGLAAGARVAGYRLEEQVGAGGMAVVFRARDERLSRRVALKVLAPALAADEAFRQRFVRESRAAAAVDDPHIIPVHEAGEAGGVLFIAMRYVAGGDVRSLLDREGPLAPARAAAIISPVASALDAAHEAGLVHRDVKPANMLLDVRPGRPDHVYLSDFGLSKVALSSGGLTRSGQYLGTLHYSAPEQIEGRVVDGRADQYALACAAFELLTGSPPFSREQATAVIWAHMSEPPPLLTFRRPDLPPAADTVLARALAKTPADRYASCREFADALRDALGLVSYDVNRRVMRLADHPRTEIALPAAPGPGVGQAATPVSAAMADTAGTPPCAVAGPLPAATGVPDSGSYGVTTVAFSPDGVMLAAGDSSGSTCLWDMATGGLTATLAGLSPGGRSVEAVAFSPDGTTLVTGDTDGGTYLWDITTRTRVAALAAPGSGGVSGVAFSPDGLMLAAGDDNGSTCLWDVSSRRNIASLALPGSGGIVGVAFSPDGLMLAAGDDNGSTCLWDVSSRRNIASLALPGSGAVSGVAFSPDGSMLAAGDTDGGTYLWDATTRSWVATLTDPGSAGVLAVAFSPDGSTLAAGDANGSIHLWDVTRERKAATLKERSSQGVYSVAFSPDGTTLAAGDGNGSVHLWSWAGHARHRGLTRRRPLILRAGHPD